MLMLMHTTQHNTTQGERGRVVRDGGVGCAKCDLGGLSERRDEQTEKISPHPPRTSFQRHFSAVLGPLVVTRTRPSAYRSWLLCATGP